MPHHAHRPTDVLINYVIDKSGSMSHLADATVTGVNAFLDEQRIGDGTLLLSMTLFDTDFDVRYVATELAEVAPLGSRANRYTPSGGTALYDAVVTTIHGVDAWLALHPEFTGDIVTVIQTDGEENSSRTATLDQVNTLIGERTRRGWEFVFQGIGRAAWTEAEKFTSIPASAKFASLADSAAQLDTFTTSSRAMSTKRSTGARYEDSLREQGPSQEQP